MEVDGDFQKLQSHWYKKLAASGFEDCEQVRETFTDLKRTEGFYFYRHYTSERIQDAYSYYHEAGLFLWRHKFKNAREKKIWKLHSEGVARRAIALQIKIPDARVQTILTGLRKIMMALPEEKIKKSDLFKRRFYLAEDKNFIISTWVKGYHQGNQIIKKTNGEKERFYGNAWFREINQKLFHDRYSKFIEALLPKCEIPIICLVSDPSVVLGYAVVDGTRLHWIYIKEMWRGIGLAKDLLKPYSITECTHLTALGQLIKPSHIQFNPFI